MSASSLERELACPGSTALSHAYATGNRWTDRGQDLHRFVRRVVRGVPLSDAILDVPESHRDTAASVDFHKLTVGMSQIRSEHAFAIDVDSLATRFLGEDIGRQYPTDLSPSEFVGTEDIGGIVFGTNVTTDIKTGWEPVTEVARNPQVAFFALRASLATGASEVIGRIAYIRPSGRVDFDEHRFRRIELEEFADALLDLSHRIPLARQELENTGTVTVTSGSYCRYCPAAHVCPAKTSLARAMLGELQEIHRGLPVLTPAQQGAAWVKSKEIEKLNETIQTHLKDVVRGRDTVLPGGKKQLSTLVSERTSFSTAKALDLLHRLGATREQIDECYATAAVETIRSVNVPKAKGGQAA